MTQAPSPRTPGVWRTSVVAGMASYIDAAAIVTFGIAVVIYQRVFDLTGTQVGIASGVLTFSIAIGALLGGRLGDRFGRRPVFTVTMIAIVAGSAVLVLAPSFELILAGAVVLGLASGADLPVSLSTISEAADDTNRGKMLGLSNILWACGILVSTVLSVVVGNQGHIGGQLLFAHVGVVALVVMVARLAIPESARWQEARTEQLLVVGAERASTLSLLRAPYLVPFLGLIVFYALVNLAANTSGQFGVYLLVNFADVDVSTASLVGLTIAPLNFISYFWFMRIADGRHRFRYFTVGALLWVAGLAVIAVFGLSITTYLVSAALAAFGMGFAFETIMKVWAQTSFPTLARSTAQGTIISTARILSAVLASATPAIAAAGPSLLYALLAAVVAAGMTVAWVVFRRRDSRSEFEMHTRGRWLTPPPAQRIS